MIKGVEIGSFEINSTLSQGQREWLDETALTADFPRKARPSSPRIATQRITGVDERRPLVASIISEDAWFADSTNSVGHVEGAHLDLDYLVALLNSDLMQWRFRLTSTNNNVGTNELLSLPIRVPQRSSIADRRAYETIRATGQRITDIKARRALNKSMATDDMLSRRLDDAWEKLNRAVDAFYGLSDGDRSLISSRLNRKPVIAADSVS